MALDHIGLAMIAPRVKGARVLCLGYPDITVPAQEVERLLGVKPTRFTNHGRDHKVDFPLPETVATLVQAGATAVDCVDVKRWRGCEEIVDLNVRQAWKQQYGLVINPGTIEHCFDVAAAMFNAWRAVAPGGAVLHVAPMTMLNHGFWNVCPTVFVDFARRNGGLVIEARARDRDWNVVPVEFVQRYVVPAESVLYALVEKVAAVPEAVPVQGRYA